jgi:hypothetical protein
LGRGGRGLAAKSVPFLIAARITMSRLSGGSSDDEVLVLIVALSYMG